MEHIKRMHLFQAYGIELEYMIVDKDTLNILPVADKLLFDANGAIANEYMDGSVTWSNELVNHVIELKCTVPTKNLSQLNIDLKASIKKINGLLKKYNAKLMPSAAHPWMDPHIETELWPHGQSDIYGAYNRIFDCKGHGWSNLQSMHINLPFYDDEEFAMLHSAARLVLPILPGLAASSPILNGKFTGFLDKRLYYYQRNQKRVPSITGKVIPEDIHSRRQYAKQVYDKIEEEIRPLDPEGVLESNWLNSRGIIPKFEIGALEIRLLDIQECPKADLAIAALVISVIKGLVQEKISSHSKHKVETHILVDVFQKSIESAENTTVSDIQYLNALGITAEKMKIGEIWKHLLDKAQELNPNTMADFAPTAKKIVEKGTLASRIIEAVDNEYNHANLKLIYQELTENLSEDKQFQPCNQSILS